MNTEITDNATTTTQITMCIFWIYSTLSVTSRYLKRSNLKSQVWLGQFVDIQNHVTLRGVLWGRQLFILRASHGRALSQYKYRFSGMEIPMFKIRRSRDRLIFKKGIPILVRRHLYIETGPKLLECCDTGTLVVGRATGCLYSFMTQGNIWDLMNI